MIFNFLSSTKPLKRSNFIPPKRQKNIKVFKEYDNRKRFFQNRKLLVSVSSIFLFGSILIGGSAYANHSYPETSDTNYVQMMEPQTFKVSDKAKNIEVEPRGSFSVEIVKPKISWAGYADAGSFINDPTAKIQYPFGIGIQITSPYGARTPICVNGKCNSGWHDGTDFGAPEGTPVQSIADGTVTYASCEGNYGCHVQIEHQINGNTITSLYAHLKTDSINVKVGQSVEVGDLIGSVGNTGFSDGDHLHFEIWVNGERIDPMSWDMWNTK